ncbi:cytochrome c [Dokdonella sp.]|uniref:cytochrome c n=1 Tax=Dokdonella sp. TaxID=2291710 RepID=UPI00260316C5|nr:cytochrome c [Dokdonella sp.]
MFKRLLVGLVLLVLIGCAAFAALAWRPSIAPVAPAPVSSFPADLVTRGARVAAAGYCVTCHTAAGGQTLAGGYAFPSPFGTIYSSNITPDPQHGIGAWSEEAFVRAVREGVARDGSHLYPALPYTHFTLATDEDMQALYAWVMSQPPVATDPPADTVRFPFNVRALQAGWKLLYFRNARFQPTPGRSEEWNRGAYLAEGLSHCAACHTPRNGVAAEKGGTEAYAGAVIDGWYAPPLTAANRSPVPWTKEELEAFLGRGGSALHGVAAGSMSHVVHDGLALLPPSDVAAIATYFADLNGSAARTGETAAAVQKALAASAEGTSVQVVDRGGEIYRAACAYCHYNRGEAALQRPELALNSAVSAPEPDTLVQVVLHGVGIKDGLPGLMMPPYGQALSDGDIAQLAAWLRRTRTDQPPWPNLEKRIAELRRPGGDA